MTSLADSLLEIEGITRLNYHDAMLFREAFDKHEPAYANSWLYMLRSARRDNGEPGYKFHRDGVLLGLGYRNGHLYLTNPVGLHRAEVVMDLCSEIGRRLAFPIILKKVDAWLYETLIQTRLFRGQYHKHRLGVFEDDTFPECELDLERLFDAHGNVRQQAKNLRRKVAKFEHASIEILPCWQVPNCSLATMLELFNELCGYKQDKYSAYISIITDLLDHPSHPKRYRVCSLYQGDKLHGFYVGELLNSECMGLYCAVSSCTKDGITEWLDVYFFKSALQDGIKSILIGGSENQGVYNYVKKLLPQAPNAPKFALAY